MIQYYLVAQISLVAQTVKRLPTMQETRVRSLGREDPLEKEMATHSSILAWRIPIDRGAWWAAVHGVAGNQTQFSYTHTHTYVVVQSLSHVQLFLQPHGL